MAITTLNTNPNSAYTLDDFDETKNYHRVLFKPGVAVQARELTQMQTAIQRQIDYHGQYSFTDGSRVVGGKVSLEVNYDYIKVEDTFTTGGDAYVTSSYMGDYKGSIIEGATSGVRAKVLQVINAAGTDVNDSTKNGILDDPTGDAITLYLQYVKGDADPSDVTQGGNNKTFLAGEIIKLLDDNGNELTEKKTRVGGFGNGDTLAGGSASTATASNYIGSGTFVSDTANDSEITSAEAVGKGSAVSIEEGAYFIKGTFVYIQPQSVILSKYSNTPSHFIGLEVSEKVINSATDSTLNDNATGTTNLSAPGADRYQITTKLIKSTKNSTPNSEFSTYVLLMTIENGVVASDRSNGDPNNTTELTRRLARRTKEESGNYSVEPFKYEIREYLNNEGGNNGFKTATTIQSDEDTVNNSADAIVFGKNRLAFGIQPNTIYVEGFRVQNLKTQYIPIEKPRTETLAVTDVEREINYGNYFKIDASTVKGMPDVNNFTIATLQKSSSSSTAICHFAAISGTGPTANRDTNQKIRYEQLNANSSNNFKRTNVDGTSSTVSLSKTGAGTGLIFELTVLFDGSVKVEILSGGTGYTTSYDVTIPAAQFGGSSSTNIQLDTPRLGLGTCRVRSIEQHPASANNSIMRLHVFDVNITSESLQDVQRINQLHELTSGPTSDATLTDFEAHLNSSDVGKLYTNSRNGPATIQVFPMPYTSVKHMGSHNSEVPRVKLKKKVKFDKSANSSTSVTIANAFASGETLVGSTAFLTQDSAAGATLITNASQSGSSLVIASGLNSSEDDTDCNIIFTIEKPHTDPSGNISLRTRTKAYSNIAASPFNGYGFDGHSPILLNKADVQKVYYVYDEQSAIRTSVTSLGGAAGSSQLTLSSANTDIIPGMQIVKRTSDESAAEPVSYGQVVAVTGAVVTLSRPLPSSAGGQNVTFFNNILNQFTFDDGQRDAFYDESKLIPKSASAVIANLKIKFKYYSHSAGDYFTVDSFTGSGAAAEKENFNKSYKHVMLRDSIDFRPIKAVTNGSSAPTLGKEFSSGAGAIKGRSPAEGQRVVSDMEFYLPRIDKIIVNRDGSFKVIQGKAGLIPTVPEDRANAMTLFTLSLKGYMYRQLPLKDFKVETHNYKRYQMKDIATLDDRIKKLEYYTSLNFLESAATNQHMVDSTGNPMFKNGIFVDSFKGHNKGNVNHPDYLNSIDRAAGVLRPHTNTRNILLRRYANDKGASGIGTEPKESKIVEKNSIYTLPYTNTAFIEQPYAADSIKVNPYNIFTWGGVMHLSPDSDEWIDTVHRPDVVIDQVGVYNSLLAQLEENNAIGTFWNHWETQHTGVNVGDSTTSSTQLETSNTDKNGAARAMATSTGTLMDHWSAGEHNSGWQSYNNQHIDVNSLINDPNGEWWDTGLDDNKGMRILVEETLTSEVTFHDQTRDGFRNDIVIDTQLETQGTKVVETQIVPFMRPRDIYFRAEHLKPNTKFYPFFDGVDVSQYCELVSADYGPDGFIEWSKQEAVQSSSLYNKDNLVGNGPLITDAGGKLFGKFRIPNNVNGLRFKNGTREFRISDDPSNNTEIENSYAEATYYAAGAIQHLEETIHSTRVPRIETTQLVDSQTVHEDPVTKTTQRVQYIDPLAQTFICDQPGGMFTTKLDLFVAGADKTGGNGEKTSIPLRVSLRLVENGIPTQKIVPGSDVTVYYNSQTNGHNASQLVVGDTYTIHSVGNGQWSNCGWIANQPGPNGDKHGGSPSAGDSFICTHATAGAASGDTTGIARAENTCYQSDITNDATVACPITFEHPVFLSEATEYSIVLIASSELWKVFFSETGRFDITGSATEPALITKQPYNGVFFTSQNASTWTPHQLRDLKFNLYRANFDINANNNAVNYKVNFVNDDLEADKLETNPFTYISKPDSSTTVIRVRHKNHGMYTGNQKGAASTTINSKVVLSGCVNENGLTAANLNAAAGYQVHDIEHDSYCITVPGQATTLDIKGGGSTVFANGNAQFNNLYVYNENFQPNGTNISASFVATAGRSMDGDKRSRTGQALDYNDVSSSIVSLNKNHSLEFPCLIASPKNEVFMADTIDSVFNQKSFGLTLTFTNNSNFISPVVDARRFSLYATQNRISDPSAYNDGNIYYKTVEDVTQQAGQVVTSGATTQNSFYNNSAGAGRFYVSNASPIGCDDINNYITKTVRLENSANELRVLANVLRAFDSNVSLYYKTSPNPDASFDLLPWTYAQPENNISIESGFDNVEWIINPGSGPGWRGFTTFALKIVLSGKDSSNIPMLRNFRAIAAT
jgi:hypothetical protein